MVGLVGDGPTRPGQGLHPRQAGLETALRLPSRAPDADRHARARADGRDGARLPRGGRRPPARTRGDAGGCLRRPAHPPLRRRAARRRDAIAARGGRAGSIPRSWQRWAGEPTSTRPGRGHGRRRASPAAPRASSTHKLANWSRRAPLHLPVLRDRPARRRRADRGAGLPALRGLRRHHGQPGARPRAPRGPQTPGEVLAWTGDAAGLSGGRGRSAPSFEDARDAARPRRGEQPGRLRRVLDVRPRRAGRPGGVRPLLRPGRSERCAAGSPRAHVTATSASSRSLARTARWPPRDAHAVGARAGDVARGVADDHRPLARVRRAAGPRAARAIAGQLGAVLAVRAEGALAAPEVVADARARRA